jgi:hypothetical protein
MADAQTRRIIPHVVEPQFGSTALSGRFVPKKSPSVVCLKDEEFHIA